MSSDLQIEGLKMNNKATKYADIKIGLLLYWNEDQIIEENCNNILTNQQSSAKPPTVSF